MSNRLEHFDRMRRHKFITKEIEKALPPLGSSDGKDENSIMVVAKWFDPCSSWTWYAIEYDPDAEPDAEFLGVSQDQVLKGYFFGLVVGHEIEMGNFTRHELATTLNRLNIPIERDCHWKPMNLAKVRALHER